MADSLQRGLAALENDVASADGESEDRPLDSGAPKRVRVARACEPCRKLKIRCDGVNPCVQCLRKDRECLYRPAEVPSFASSWRGENSTELDRSPNAQPDRQALRSDSLTAEEGPHPSLAQNASDRGHIGETSGGSLMSGVVPSDVRRVSLPGFMSSQSGLPPSGELPSDTASIEPSSR
jgi:hypothetical protein